MGSSNHQKVHSYHYGLPSLFYSFLVGFFLANVTIVGTRISGSSKQQDLLVVGSTTHHDSSSSKGGGYSKHPAAPDVMAVVAAAVDDNDDDDDDDDVSLTTTSSTTTTILDHAYVEELVKSMTNKIVRLEKEKVDLLLQISNMEKKKTLMMKQQNDDDDDDDDDIIMVEEESIDEGINETANTNTNTKEKKTTTKDNTNNNNNKKKSLLKTTDNKNKNMKVAETTTTTTTTTTAVEANNDTTKKKKKKKTDELGSSRILPKSSSPSMRTIITSTEFDKIVQKSYRDAIAATSNTNSDITTGGEATEEEEETTQQKQQQKRRNNKFNITFWENQSNLTTDGGLQTLDRILLAEIYGSASSVFEYGLGESTYLADYLGVPRYAGIDSDPIFVSEARNKVQNPNYRFYFADVGSTTDWGHPQDTTLGKIVFNYQIQPLLVEQQPFDVYMVDGRYRLPCMLASFLHASSSRQKGQLEHDNNNHYDNKTIVIVHDCYDKKELEKNKPGALHQLNSIQVRQRDVYHQADHLLDMVNHSGDRLCVYKRKPTTTDEQLSNLWLQYSEVVMRR